MAAADPATRPELRALRRRPLWAPLAVPALGFAALVALGALLWSLQSTTTVVVVRHAEKQLDAGDDPGLTPDGVARAARLAAQFGGAGVAAVYATPYRRTRETAAPTAAAAGVPVVEYDPKDPAALAETVLDDHRGALVLVVGHSNTVGGVVRAFGGEAPGSIPDDEYGELFLVNVPRFGPPRTLRLRTP